MRVIPKSKSFATSLNLLVLTALVGSGVLVGLGVELSASPIKVYAGTTFYDFVDHAADASWSSYAGDLPFPGSGSDNRGFALYAYNAVLEDGSNWKRVLETHPQWVTGGWIAGKYPQQTIPQNARLSVNVGFLSGATGTDGAIFKVLFLGKGDEIPTTLLSHLATYDNRLDLITVDLSPLAGITGHFTLQVEAGQSSGQDWAVWAEARIERLLPDLVAADISWTPEEPKVWQQVEVAVVVKNIGDGTSSSCIGQLFADGDLVVSGEIPSLQPGEAETVTLAWTPTAEGEYVIRFEVDFNEEVDELDELNNAAEATVSVRAEDNTPPEVTITHDPLEPTEIDTVTFHATASDPSGIDYIQILVNGELKETFDDSTQCDYVGGPYPRKSTVSYAAQASDKAGNIFTTPWYNFTVKPYYTEPLTIDIGIDPAEPTEVDEVSFTAAASSPYGIRQLQIHIQGKVFDCEVAPCEKVPCERPTTCTIIGGPWTSGTTVTYWADAYDVDGHYERTPERTFTVGALRTWNVKNMSNYRDREVFVISDLDWRAVLSLVPIAVWRETGGVTYNYPALIYHKETERAFDADSTIRFLQQYLLQMSRERRRDVRVTILGQPPEDLVRLMVALRPIGAGLDEDQIRIWRSRSVGLSDSFISLEISPVEASVFRSALETKWDVSVTIPPGGTVGRVPMENIFSVEEERQLRADYWSTLNVYVISQDRYATGLMASVFASYINAPILFQGHYDLDELSHKSVYLVGSFTEDEIRTMEEGDVRILSTYTLEQLRRYYVATTRTNKAILVNPLDLWIHYRQRYGTDMASYVDYLFGKHSLAAPFLAAAKKEVIISIASSSYPEIDIFVKQNLESLFFGTGLKYLTIVASPEAIPIARPNLAYPAALWGDKIYYHGSRFNDVDIVSNNLLGTSEDYATLRSGVQLSPACSEDILAWVDERQSGDIYYRDLSTGTDFRLTNQRDGQIRPAVHGTRIVWQDFRHTYVVGGETKHQWEIYMHDADTGVRTRVTTSNAHQEYPSIWGDIIVWQDNRAGNWDIYKYDVNTGEEVRLTWEPFSQVWPSISGDRIVYANNRAGNWDIYMISLVRGEFLRFSESWPVTIAIDPADQKYPRIYDERIVWQDNRHGNWDIYMYDVTTESEHRVTHEPIDQVFPVIFEDKIAWYERSEEGWWYVCLYDVSTGSRSRIARTEVSSDDGAWWLEVDGRYYGSTQNLARQDVATGRIYGVTVSDASAYIARDVFIDRIRGRRRRALVVVREDWQPETAGGAKDEAVLEAYARAQYWTPSVEDEFPYTFFCSGHDEVARHSYLISAVAYHSHDLLIFVDHGWRGGFSGMMDSTYLKDNRTYLKPATVLDLACSTGAYHGTSDKAMLFSAQNMRRGAMVFMGATDVSYWHRMFDDILYGVYVEGKTIGEAYLEARNEEYHEDVWNFSVTLRGDIFYALHGDPTFRPKWWG